MKIAVVGCGAVGSYYGARLARAGHNVHFLLRSDFDAVSRDGVEIRTPSGKFRVKPFPAKTPQEIGVCDVVLVALKTTANAQLDALVRPLLGDHSVALTLQNGLGNEDALARVANPSQVMGGLCFVCLNRIAPGIILHLAHGQVVLGDFLPRDGSRRENLTRLLEAAGIPCRPTTNLAQARWEKLVWNIPFNGLGVASAAGLEALLSGEAAPSPIQPCMTTDQLIADPQWERLLRELMAEVILAARAQHLPLSDDLIERQLNLTRNMGPYKASTLLDFELHRPLELESMFLEPLRRAKAAGANVPRLEMLCRVLAALDQDRHAG